MFLWIHRLAAWLAKATAPPAVLTGAQWSGTTFTDRYARNRQPTANELLAELKGVAWACASLNAAVCANYPPRLYVSTGSGQPAARTSTRSLSHERYRRIKNHPAFRARAKSAHTIAEVIEHPLLELLQMPTPAGVSLNAFDLWELTQLYLETHGKAYWLLQRDRLGVPRSAWVLPAQNVTPKRAAGSQALIDVFSYRNGGAESDFAAEDVVFFRYPDPRDPYLGGLSPLRAAFEQVSLTSHFAARKEAIFQNDAIPAALVSPDQVMGEEERDRLESQWNAVLRRGGAGRVVVAESPMRVSILQHSLGDLALLAEMGATKELIANSFHVPIAFWTTSTNLANLQAAQSQHYDQCIGPRLTRRDEKLNEQLVPLFDDSGRLFLASDDPQPVDAQLGLQWQAQDLKLGVVTINEVRSERGLPPVPWGDEPWLPMQWAQTSYAGRIDQNIAHSPDVGRNKPDHSEE
jgi:HK97 family phage portal protein